MNEHLRGPPISDVERVLYADARLLGIRDVGEMPDDERHRRMFNEAMARLPEDVRERIRAELTT